MGGGIEKGIDHRSGGPGGALRGNCKDNLMLWRVV